jgi:hypothetical protein
VVQGPQVEDVPLASHLRAAFPAPPSPFIRRLPCQSLEEGLVVSRVGVDEHQPPRLAAAGEVERVAEAGMAPQDQLERLLAGFRSGFRLSHRVACACRAYAAAASGAGPASSAAPGCSMT